MRASGDVCGVDGCRVAKGYTFLSWDNTSGHISHTKFKNFNIIIFNFIEFYIMLHEVDRDYSLVFADECSHQVTQSK